MNTPPHANVELYGRDFDFTVVEGVVEFSTPDYISALAVFDGPAGEISMKIEELGDEDAMRAIADAPSFI